MEWTAMCILIQTLAKEPDSRYKSKLFKGFRHTTPTTFYTLLE